MGALQFQQGLSQQQQRQLSEQQQQLSDQKRQHDELTRQMVRLQEMVEQVGQQQATNPGQPQPPVIDPQASASAP
ncbi:hypothetical protein BGZ59_004341, partial [Podila verticillata]